MKSNLLVIPALIITALFTTNVDADLVFSTNVDNFTSSSIPAGTDLTGTSTNNTPDIYLEATNQTADSLVINDISSSGSLLTTSTAITPSTPFDVFYVHFFAGERTDVAGILTFDGPIIGVAGTNGFAGSDVVLGDASSTAFQVPGVIYDDATDTSGIQEGGSDDYTVVGNSIIFTPATAGAGNTDNYRVYVQAVSAEELQAIPEPSSVALLGLGALALFARRRR